MKPDFIIPGAQKSGTTSLYHLLKRHPQICMSNKKETHFFDLEQNFQKGKSWYFNHFAHCNNNSIKGDNTPFYIFLDHVPERIFNLIPQVKIIFILRNPVDRAWSHYWHEVKKGRERFSFEKALDQEENRIKKGFYELQHFSYLSRGKYIEQIQNYNKFFEISNMHFVKFEEFKNNPDKVLNGIFNFLEIEIDSVNSSINGATNKGLRPRSRNLAYIFYNTFLGKYKSIGILHKHLNMKPLNAEIAQKTRNELISYFKPYNNELQHFTGMYVQDWNNIINEDSS